MDNLKIIKYAAVSKYNNDENSQILDPFSTIYKLALLSYKPEGSKISIYNNRIYYSEPGLLQGVIRTLYGDKKDDIHNIKKPIELCIEWIKEKHSNIEKDFKIVFQKAILGLNKLTLSYVENTLTCHCIQSYVSIINNNLDNNKLENKIKFNNNFKNNNTKNVNKYNNNSKNNKNKSNFTIEDEDNSDEYSDEEDINKNIKDDNINILFMSLKNIWNTDELSIINSLLIQIDNHYNINYINSILNIIEEKDNIIKGIVDDIYKGR